MKKKIFINYRRDDTLAGSQKINDILRDSFDLFFDKDGAISYGSEFPQVLQNGVEDSSVVLCIIGSKYAQSFATKADNGSNDYVLEELQIAKSKGIQILPIVIDGAKMPSANELPQELGFLTTIHCYELLTSNINIFKDDLIETIEKLIPQKDDFIEEVLGSVYSDRLVVIFSQEFTPIDRYMIELREIIQQRFKDACYMISIPPYLDDEEEYFRRISKEIDTAKSIKRVSDWDSAIREQLNRSIKPVILFVTNIENGDSKLNRKFATILRNLKDEFPNFYAICIGRKDLAKLVYGEGHLSPLNTAKELFVPEQDTILGEDRIVQQFNSLSKYRDIICRYLQKEDICHFCVWTNSIVIDDLFWRNLLVKRGNRLVWRGEVTKKLAREALACGE